MRPVRLQVEGFTCYREPQTPLTFDGLTLFAIAGPTGAGKSSILDAILFALYGQVPRIGKQGFGDFISQGRDALSVALDFTVRGTTYRVVRKVKRTRSGGLTTTAILEEVEPTPRAIADQVRPVNDEIVRLLGLGFDAFTQTVILPQGEFHKFLKADPKEQRGILQHLLRHGIYERMREEAERRKREADQAVQVLERTLEATAHATPEALEDALAGLEARRVSLAASTQEKDAQAGLLAQVRLRRQLTTEVETLRSSLAALDNAAPAMATARAELDAARSAAVVVPRIDAARAALDRRAAASREEEDARSVAASSERAVEQAEALAARALAEAGGVEALLARIRALDEIKGELARRDAIAQDLAVLKRSGVALRKDADDAAASLARARSELEEAESQVQTHHAALDGAGFDAVADQRLQDVWERVLGLRAAADEVERLDAAFSSVEASLTAAERALASADTALRKATREAERAAAAEQAAAAARDAGRQKHQAVSLRDHLHAGEACPVCLQTVVLLPPRERVPELEGLDREWETAKRAAADAVRAQQIAAERRAGAAVARDAAVQARDAATALRDDKRNLAATYTAAIRLALAVAQADADDPRALIAAVEAQRDAVRHARQTHERAAALLRLAEGTAAKARVSVAHAEARARAATDALERARADHERLTAERGQVVARIAAVSAHDDPGVERADLARQVAELETGRRRADDALALARQADASARARLAAASAALTQAAADAEAANDDLRTAMAASGFSEPADARAAVRTPQEQALLDRQIREHETAAASTRSRLEAIEPQVSGCEVSAAALTAAEARCQTAFDAWREADIDVARRETAVARLSDEVERRAVQVAELSTRAASRNLLNGMAADLKTDAFQNYLLEEAFRALVTGASVRMRQMSDRYTLAWRDGAFYVVDHDNAGDQRRAETLSGGETFMASLCLALQLSDEVLKTSGALQMDSLFIDEGFGTLDADSLTEVTNAMEALREGGSRLIGVISHRPELTERLPGCIRVSKGAGESRWALERAG